VGWRAGVVDVMDEPTMSNPRDYPNTIQSAESGRMLRRGVKMLTITIDGEVYLRAAGVVGLDRRSTRQ
jgi:hypothetical protein